MRHIVATIVLAAGPALSSQPVCAGNWEGSVVATTDYVYRGLSQTYGDPALQVDLHYRFATGWFAGLWASNIDRRPGDRGTYELNGYAGWSRQFGPDWNARLTYLRFMYPDSPRGTDYDYDEFQASVSYRDRAFATIGWSPDTTQYSTAGYAENRRTLSYELALRQPVAASLALTGGVAYYDLHDLFDASYWSTNVVLSYTHGPWEMDVSRFWTGGSASELYGDEASGDRWVATLVWRF